MSLNNEILKAWSVRNRMKTDVDNIRRIAKEFCVSVGYANSVISEK